MHPIQVAEVAEAIANIATARGYASTAPMVERVVETVTRMFQEQLRAKNVWVVVQPTEPDYLPEMVRARVLEAIAAAEEGLRGAALPPRFHDRLARVKASVADPERFDGAGAQVRLDELLYDLLGELTEPQFLRISLEKRHFFDQAEPVFGAEVDARFPGASRDIASAGRCFALGEWTACVCHLMRAVEEPLHILASKVDVVFPKPIEFENWKNIVDRIDAEIAKEVKRIEGTPASRQRNELLKMYADASLQIRHFKNAWRNDAAHGREQYDEREAERVLVAVKSFMQMMAALP